MTERTHGNATGIGLADFTTTRLVRTMNYRATVINCMTAGYPEGANLPVHYETDRETLEAALAIIGTRSSDRARVLRIRNTLCLEEVEVSEACLQEEKPVTEFTVVNGARPITFDAAGNLPAF